AAPQSRGGRGKGPLLLGAVGVVGLLVIGAGFFGYRSLNSGFYLAKDGDQVALFEGSAKSLPVLGSQASKTKDQPGIAFADLPAKEQERVKNKITAKSRSAINAEITKLRDGQCQFTIKDDGGNAKIVKGAGQEGCAELVVDNGPDGKPLPGVEVKFLPEDRLKKFSERFATLEIATKELETLKSVADNCRSKPGANGCPKP
ncbi:hypothetical protein, partial [Actinocorallia lasiicapitis]